MKSPKNQNDPHTLAHVGAWAVEPSTNTESNDIILEPHPDIHYVSRQSSAAILAGYYPSATTTSSRQYANGTLRIKEKSGDAGSTCVEPSWSERSA
jgi:hypothetical protein